MSRLLSAAAIMASFALIPPAALAEHRFGELRFAHPTSSVRAGEVVELRWTLPARDVEELEILLSLDGGRHFNVRVTPESDPGSGRYFWRVPNLATSTARLRLRYGVEGAEVEAEPTEAFAILASPEAQPDFDRFTEGAWWRGLRPAAAPPPSAGLARPGASLSAERRASACENEPRSNGPGLGSDGRLVTRPGPAAPAPTTARLATTPERFQPMRN